MQKKYTIEVHDADPRIAVYRQIMNLKGLFRQGWLKQGISAEVCESVADHSFGTTLLALLLCPPELDASKVLQMAILHEAGESLIGDITPHDGVSRDDKRNLEEDAVRRLFAIVPEGGKWLALWREFEYGTSEEGRFVQQLDKLEMGLQAQTFAQLTQIDTSGFVSSALTALSHPALTGILTNQKHTKEE